MDKLIKNDLLIEAFLKAIEAKPTEDKPRKFTHIYWVYLKYCILNNIEPLDRIPFGMALAKQVKNLVCKDRHETKYYIDCELLNLKYEDKIALKEYNKEETAWRQKEQKRKRQLKERRKKAREKKRLKKESELNTKDSINDSSPESNKNTTT
jgi:hypothetical protein